MNLKKLNLVTNIIKYVLVGLGVIAGLLIIFSGVNANSEKEVIDNFRDGGAMSFTALFTIIVIVACVALVLLFFISQLISNPKKTLLSIIGIAAALLIYLLFLAIGSSDTNESLRLRDPVADSTLTSTSAGILTVLLAIAATFLAAIWGFVGRLKK